MHDARHSNPKSLMCAESSRRMRSTHSGSSHRLSLASLSGSGLSDKAALPTSSATRGTSWLATEAATLSPRTHNNASHPPSAQQSQPQSPRSTGASSDLQPLCTPQASALSDGQSGADLIEKYANYDRDHQLLSPRPQLAGAERLENATVPVAKGASGGDRSPASSGNRVSKGLSLLTRRLKRGDG
jgi:hypothetical protein